MARSSSDTEQSGGHKSLSERSSRDTSGSIAPDLSSLTDTSAVQRTAADSAVGPQTDGPSTRGQYAQRYGVDIDKPGQADQLQRLEAANSLETVQRWADEGIPIEAMGTPSKMQAFRQRKGTPVPWDIEQRNEASKRRNTSAVQRKTRERPAGNTRVPKSVRSVVSERGTPVAAALRKRVEAETGKSLRHARVHRSPAADAACRQLNARAFTIKNHIAVRSDQPDLDTPAGQHLMSHELTHVAQQTGGAVSLLPDAGPLKVDPKPKLEREAEETAQRVMQGGDLGIQRLSDTDVHIQRSIFSKNTSKKYPVTSGNDSRVDQSLRGAGLSKEEWETRGARLRGETRRADGRPIPGAVRQTGGSCWLAVLQATWAALGADTTSLRKILNNYLDSQRPPMMSSYWIKPLRSVLKDVNVAEDIKKRVLKEVGGIETSLSNISHDVKGVALALARLYQLRRDTQDSDGQSALVTDEDLRIGRNLLHMVSHTSQKKVMNSESMWIFPSSDMGALKRKFMKAVERFGTPLIIQHCSSFSRSAGIVKYGNILVGHATIIAGVHVEDDGTVYVMCRDSNRPPNTYDVQTLTEVLTPRYSPEIRKRLKTSPGLTDVLTIGKMRSDDKTRAALTNQQ